MPKQAVQPADKEFQSSIGAGSYSRTIIETHFRDAQRGPVRPRTGHGGLPDVPELTSKVHSKHFQSAIRVPSDLGRTGYKTTGRLAVRYPPGPAVAPGCLLQPPKFAIGQEKLESSVG